MANYKYTQKFWTDDEEEHPAYNIGHVNYNITPDFNSGVYVTSETSIELQFEVYNSHFASKSFSITVTDGTNVSSASIDIVIPKSTVKRFSLKLYLRDISDWSNDRTFYVTPYFTFCTETGGLGQGEFTVWNTPEIRSQQRITYLKYDIKPSIDNLIFDRYEFDEENQIYVRNDEGSFVLGNFKISLADGYGINDIDIDQGHNVTKVKVTDENDNLILERIIPVSVLTAALSTNGYVETSPSLFENISFDSSIDYTIEFIVGDLYTKTTASIDISRAFANLHLSGQKTGGVAFGRFSSSTENDPKFECEYPSYLTGGISELGNVNGSQMAMGLQSGIIPSTQITKSSATESTIAFKRKYAVPPVVVCGMISDNNYHIGRCAVSVSNVSESGFTLNRINYYDGALSFGAYWIAIGQPNTDPNSWGVITLKRPAAAMTSNSSQGCVASASSEYSSKYKAYQAFSSNREKGWASAENVSDDPQPWLQLEMDVALKNIIVSVYSRDNSNIYNPTAGEILGSNDGVSFTSIGSFSGWKGDAKNALLGTVECGNSTAYKYVRISITGKTSSSHYAAIGHVDIEGDYEEQSNE